MLIEERRRAILKILEDEDRAVVRDLATRFHTSEITIRKDLKVLHRQGELERIHGGALPVKSRAPTYNSRQQEWHRQKEKRIAKAAAQMIGNNQVIVLDSGTTTTEIARQCRDLKNLTIITNALNIGTELANSPVEVIFIGGFLQKHSLSLVSPLAEDSLRKRRADFIFLTADAFDVSYGLTTPNPPEASMKRLMADLSRRVVVVCDSTKFDRRSLFLILPTVAVHDTITDKNISKRALMELREANIRVRLV